MFKSALDIIREAGGRTSDSDHNLFFAVTGAKPFVFFRIGRELARKAGLALGDRVLFGMDMETGIARLYADPKGRKLVSGNSKSDDPPLVLRMTWVKGFPFIPNGAFCQEVIAKPHTIYFKYPPGTTHEPVGVKRAFPIAAARGENELYVEHKKLVEREERVNKAARKDTLMDGSLHTMVRDGLPYGRRKGDKRARR